MERRYLRGASRGGGVGGREGEGMEEVRTPQGHDSFPSPGGWKLLAYFFFY